MGIEQAVNCCTRGAVYSEDDSWPLYIIPYPCMPVQLNDNKNSAFA